MQAFYPEPPHKFVSLFNPPLCRFAFMENHFEFQEFPETFNIVQMNLFDRRYKGSAAFERALRSRTLAIAIHAGNRVQMSTNTE